MKEWSDKKTIRTLFFLFFGTVLLHLWSSERNKYVLEQVLNRHEKELQKEREAKIDVSLDGFENCNREADVCQAIFADGFKKWKEIHEKIRAAEVAPTSQQP